MPSSASHPVASLPLPRRAINALREAGIVMLEETNDWSDEALLSLRRFGRAYLAALRRFAADTRNLEH